MDFQDVRDKVEALTHPRNVVLVGASDRPGSWAARVWRNLNRYAFPGNIHLFNPGRDEVFGQKCYRDFASMPEAPDHLIVLVPAQHVPSLLRAGAAAGARSATVFSSGFGEAFDKDGEKLGRELRKAIKDTGLGVSGPNCMGNICGPSSFVTLTEDRPLLPGHGPVALVGQSGGVMIFCNQALGERGIKAGYLITSGNEAGLSAADYIAYFATQPEIKVIIVYVEALKDVGRFSAACRDARAKGKHVVAIKLGASEAGRNAAMAHTGSLAGSLEAFDALAADLGIVRAETLDDAVEITELLVHTGAAPGMRLGAITLSGAYRGLLLDASEKHGVQFPALQQATLDRLNAILGVGSLVSNPIDGGFGVLTSADNFMNSIIALEDDPGIDMVLLQESLPREPGSDRAEKYIAMVEDYVRTRARKPISFITPVTHSQTDYSRNLRDGARHVSFLQEANRALRAISATGRAASSSAIAAAPVDKPNTAQRAALSVLKEHLKQATSPVALNERVSKSILSEWNLRFAPEHLAKSPAAAAAAARKIGFPVVLKAVSATLTHKSDAGAVVLNIKSEKALAAAWNRIRENVKAYCGKHGVTHKIEGMIVAKQVSGGLELVLGLHRDPEAGLVLMVGMGGVWLELIKDVAFAIPPVTREKAQAMLAQTRAGILLGGYRGGPVHDVDSVIDAMVALGNFAAHAGASVEFCRSQSIYCSSRGTGRFRAGCPGDWPPRTTEQCIMTLIINNDDVHRLLTMRDTIDALEQSYSDMANGEAVCRPRIDIRIPTEDPAKNYQWGTMEGGSTRGYFAIRMKSDIIYETKYNGVTTQEKYCREPGTYCGLILLTSIHNGEPLAFINDGHLQHMRVGADGGIGVKYMSNPDAEVVGMLGSGGMSRTHMMAFTCVRNIRKLQVFSPTRQIAKVSQRKCAQPTILKLSSAMRRSRCIAAPILLLR